MNSGIFHSFIGAQGSLVSINLTQTEIVQVPDKNQSLLKRQSASLKLLQILGYLVAF